MKIRFLALLLFCSSQLIIAQNKNFIDQPYLETSARADTLVAPDLIYLQIQIAETDSRNKVSVEKQENQMADVLKKLEIDLSKQLSLSDVGSNFKKYFLKEKGVVKRKSFDLVVYDAQTAGMVILGLEGVGISNVTLWKTAYSQMDLLKLELKSKAVMLAQKQAEYLVKLLPTKVSYPIHIVDRTYSYAEDYGPASFQVRAFNSESEPNPQPLDIQFKAIEVYSEVNVKFKLVDQ